jgi:hypothetical protein
VIRHGGKVHNVGSWKAPFAGMTALVCARQSFAPAELTGRPGGLPVTEIFNVLQGPGHPLGRLQLVRNTDRPGQSFYTGHSPKTRSSTPEETQRIHRCRITPDNRGRSRS